MELLWFIWSLCSEFGMNGRRLPSLDIWNLSKFSLNFVSVRTNFLLMKSSLANLEFPPIQRAQKRIARCIGNSDLLHSGLFSPGPLAVRPLVALAGQLVYTTVAQCHTQPTNQKRERERERLQRSSDSELLSETFAGSRGCQ